MMTSVSKASSKLLLLRILSSGKTYCAKSQRQEENANECKELDILAQSSRYPTFDDGACCEELQPVVRYGSKHIY